MTDRSPTPLVNHRLLQRAAVTLRRKGTNGDEGERASLEELCLFVAAVVVFGDVFDVDPTVPPQTRELTSELTAPLSIDVRATTRPSPDEILEDTVVGGTLLLEPVERADGSRLMGSSGGDGEFGSRQEKLLSSHLDLVRYLEIQRADGEEDTTWIAESWTDKYWGNKLLAALAGVSSTATGPPPLDQYLRELRLRVDADKRAAAFWYTSTLISQMRTGYLGSAAQRTGGLYLASGPVEQAAGRVAAYDNMLRQLLQSRTTIPAQSPSSIADLIMNHTLTSAALGPVLDDRFQPERPMSLLETAREHRSPALAKAVRQAMAASKGDRHEESWVEGFVQETQRFVRRDHARRDRLVDMIAGFLATAGGFGGLGVYSPWLASLAIGAGVLEMARSGYGQHVQRTPRAVVATLLEDTADPDKLAVAEAKLSRLNLRA